MRRAIEYVEKARPPRKSVTYHLSTNGTLLTEEIVCFLEEHDFRMQLSFDGVAPAQNLRGRGTFPALDRLLDRLRTKHADFYRENVTIALTRHPPQSPAPRRFGLVSSAQRGGGITISPSISADAEWELDRIDELDAQFDRIFERSLSHYRRTAEIPIGIFRGGRGTAAPTRRARPLCGIGRLQRIAVDVDGEIYGCTCSPAHT